MNRIFKVGPTGLTLIEKTNPKELLKKNKDLFLKEIRKEETEFLREIRSYGWFQGMLKRLDLSEEEWLENQIKAQVVFVERATFCRFCRNLFENEREHKEEEVCFLCAKKVLDIIEGPKYSQYQKP